MKLSQNQKIGLIILLFAATGIILYRTYFGSSTIIADEATAADAKQAGQEILDMANSFDVVTLDTSLFSGSLFKSFVDSNAVPASDALGRPNPFAPIGSSVNTGTTK